MVSGCVFMCVCAYICVCMGVCVCACTCVHVYVRVFIIHSILWIMKVCTKNKTFTINQSHPHDTHDTLAVLVRYSITKPKRALFSFVGASLLASQFFNSVTFILDSLLSSSTRFSIITVISFNAHAPPTVFSNYANLNNEYVPLTDQ